MHYDGLYQNAVLQKLVSSYPLTFDAEIVHSVS